ncbi:rifin PIR protein, putative [Plasmodium reichenowi]|uniref:Rifin PIR protein, putative n=1 Tax=Plasmodium reichenowi TaxID=5854 RepID=A0A2P9D440_PLARE|nr:rifin PIR protein, putative [Plasmodium reichenowi]
MKVHYINILLFALALNILVYTPQKKPHNTPHHTPKILTTRLLCECELYAPSNYDSDPQMKEVMENFNKQTQQRFHEYDERMKTTRQKCKEQCDKDIQKIILKDKLEKQMEQQLTTLETKIDTNDIPTCICEKSIADKVEKGCLRCGYGLGTVAPTVGLIGSVAVHAWKPLALKSAVLAAEKAGAAKGLAAGEAAGVEALISGLMNRFNLPTINGYTLEEIITTATLKDHTILAGALKIEYQNTCMPYPDASDVLCLMEKKNYTKVIEGTTKSLVGNANKTAEAKAANVAANETAAAIKTNTGVVEAASYDWYTTVGYSVLAILIIILIMVIIYLILRHRRKKKMKKKLQYIKLLEE